MRFEEEKQQAVPDSAGASVNKGTVFVLPGGVKKLPNNVALESELLESWLLVSDDMDEDVKRGARESTGLLPDEAPVEASAFGCDSNVVERAVRRVLKKAANQGFDLVEIIEIERREESGLDYVSILARPRRIQGDSASNLVESGVEAAVL
ncbi:MAG TPA: hypothetical protein VJP02_11420 [Candidatus Sulfotelmatobacter sp.]|nr:hypothetical protein [Candidatus Sulfotelmatobacter sp.]